MKNAVILCSGAGSRFFPYATVRNKVMFPISNTPIVAFSVDRLSLLGYDNIVIVASGFSREIIAYFRDYANVKVITEPSPCGTAFSLLAAKDYISGENFLALYGDTIVSTRDLSLLADAGENEEYAALVAPIRGRSSDVIGCNVSGGAVWDIKGHSRGGSTHFFGGFALPYSFFDTLKYNSAKFTSVEVGMMPPVGEGYLEMSVADEIGRGARFAAVEAADEVYDIDKPWDIVEANNFINTERCSSLTENVLAEGASIDPTAAVNGFVSLGKNSRIGRNVIISGNIIVGDDTELINGAIVGENTVIGSRSRIRNACYIEGGSTVGDDCVVSHSAELDGIILRRVYLYHYMEICGIIGENTDIGGATVCGSLRFDDGQTIHTIKGHKEFPGDAGDCVFIGDYCRTGVNAILMPGVKVGAYSVVGAGVLLNKDVPERTLIYTEQTLVEKKWGPEKYGW